MRFRRQRPIHPIEDAGDPKATGNLPPWGMLGLGPAPTSGLDPDWEPVTDDLPETEDLPDRPPSRIGRTLKFVLPIVIGLCLVGGAVGLVRSDLLGSDDETTVTPTPSSAADLAGPASTPRQIVTGATPATSVASPARTARATRTPTAATAEPPATTPSTPVATETATRTPATPRSLAADDAFVIAVGEREVTGLDSAGLANQLRAALATTLPGREIAVVGEDRRDEAALLVTTGDPSPDFAATVVANIPMVLVTSPRLPLTEISGAQAAAIFDGTATDWRQIGAAPTLPIQVLALRDVEPAGSTPSTPVETYRTYSALVRGFEDHPGGVALVPLDAVDFRVNVLAIDGVDPLRGQGTVLNYPFGDRLTVGLRPEFQAEFQPAIDAALASLRLPRASTAVASLGIAGDLVTNPSVPADRQGDAAWLFGEIAPELSGYEVTIANLEGSLANAATSASPVAAPSAATPTVDGAAFVQGLTSAGIDAVSLANDRAFAGGAVALTRTRALLDAAGIASFGAGDGLSTARAPFQTEIDGVSIAVLGVNGISGNRDSALPGVAGNADAATASKAGTNPLVAERLTVDVQRAAEDAEIVVVALHAGVAGRATPPSWTIAAAHDAIDAGADLVVVSHSGLPGGIEVYNGQPIVYSLGSLVSDRPGAVETRQSVIMEITLRGETIAGLRLHGVMTGDDGRPRPMTDFEQAALQDRIWWLSDRLVTNG